MKHVVFKNLEHSDLARAAAMNRMDALMETFPLLRSHRLEVTLSMDNSPVQPGPDSFSARLHLTGRRYRTVLIEKTSSNLYLALAEVFEHAHERLTRHAGRHRRRDRSQARRIKTRLGGHHATDSA